MKRLCPLFLSVLAVLVLGVASPASATTVPTVAAANVFPIAPASSAPLGDLVVTETTVGQLAAGDVITFRFADSASASTFHFASAGSVSGSNGLAATVALASSNATGTPRDDEMKVTVTSPSTGSFPGAITLSGLIATTDPTAAAGNDVVTVSDTGSLTTPVTVSDAVVLTGTTTRAAFAPQSAPTVLSTGTNQAVGSVTITEPVKSFFAAGDVIHFSLRDANGSVNTVGLAGSPYAAGGAMTVSVTGTNAPSVQVNDTGFNVNIVTGDSSQGSASTITVSNLTVNTAQAPLGPVTLSAVVTVPASNTEYIMPGRVTIANVGGATTTTSSGAPAVSIGTATQPAGNVVISATAGSLVRDDTFSMTIGTPGVVFSAATPPIATVTSGDLVLQNATATLGSSGTVASWTVATGNSTAAAIVIGPIEYDVAPSATANQPVTLAVAGEAGSAFTAANVSNAVIAPSASTGTFTTDPATVPSENAAPWNGGAMTYTEAATGATPVGSDLVVISPYANQIAAYRTTFAAVPSAIATSGMTLGAPSVNSTALVVQTPSGAITAPPQTVVLFPVTAASTSGPSTVTISNLSYVIGGYVPPGALVATGVVTSSAATPGTGAALGGNQVVEAIVTRNLGTSTATTPPVVTITEEPPSLTNGNSATFSFAANETGVVFTCFVDNVLVSINCPSPITLPSLTSGTHTFAVAASNQAGYTSSPDEYSWTIDTVAPTGKLNTPTTLTSPVRITFSEPVDNLSTSDVTLSVATATGSVAVSPAPVLACASAGGTATPCATGHVSSATLQPAGPLVPGQHYVVTLNPTGVLPAIADLAGNVLATMTGAFRGQLVQDQTSPAAVASWREVTARGASGGSYAVDHLAGATCSFAFTGTSVTWYTVTGPTQGDAYVFVDGARKLTVDNYASSTHYGVARSLTGLSKGSHVIKIEVRGVKGAKSGTDTQVAVDAFSVGTLRTQQNSVGVSYTWRPVSASAASGGSYAEDDLAGAAYSFTFRGTAVKWYTVFGRNMGEAKVYIDGRLKATVNNFSSKTAYHKVHAFTGLTDALHMITIVVLGKHVAGATASDIAVDGYVVS